MLNITCTSNDRWYVLLGLHKHFGIYQWLLILDKICLGFAYKNQSDSTNVKQPVAFVRKGYKWGRSEYFEGVISIM